MEHELMDSIVLLINALCSFLSAGILFYLIIANNSPRVEKIIYGGIGIILAWVGITYTLAALGIFYVPHSEKTMIIYSDYLRPVASLLILAPSIIAVLHRKRKPHGTA